VTLAHGGVLFLDELPEWSRRALEGLRQPLEEGAIDLARARGARRFPARFALVAAMNPCPCGHDGDDGVPCRCHPVDRRRYQGRISGPLLDRFDLRLRVPRVPPRLAGAPGGEASGHRGRSGGRGPGLALARQGCPNALLAGAALERHAALDEGARACWRGPPRRAGVSARGADRLRRVARTLADLAGEPTSQPARLAEALAYRAEPFGATNRTPARDAGGIETTLVSSSGQSCQVQMSLPAVYIRCVQSQGRRARWCGRPSRRTGWPC
jgi:magnesium chelatase family protein